jgi:hypothetical protein
MSDRPTSQSLDADDSWLESALRADGREHRAEYLADDGFTTQLMTALPAPSAPPAWRKPAVAGLWAVAGVGLALALPGTVVDFAHEVLRVMIGQRVSVTGIAAGVVALGIATWAATAVALKDE